jgi:hypothetical protein
VDIPAAEVTVHARQGVVKGEQLVEVVNRTRDSAHSFKARLKRGPDRDSKTPDDP